MARYVGGIISRNGATANTSSASGIWSVADYTRFVKESNWPRFSTGLYEFTYFEFTTAGITGRTGPTLSNCLSSYNTTLNPWLNNTAYFNVTSGIQYWTVPKTGTYRIEAFGAQGGTNTDASGSTGGLGARIRGDFTLTQGEIIRILVGQRLDVTRSCGAVGGGGGSFVVRTPYNTTGSILTIAGGGGGGGRTGSTYNGVGGTTTNNGTSSPNSPSGAGGTSGNGGGVPTQGCSGPEGSGGGGFFGNGTNATTSGVGGGASFTNGGLGGDGGTGPAGGFGGGGAANGNGYGGGGGGGYSGGGGGGLSGLCDCTVMGGGGGGGSYNSGTNQSNTSATNVGNGKVQITFIA